MTDNEQIIQSYLLNALMWGCVAMLFIIPVLGCTPEPVTPRNDLKRYADLGYTDYVKFVEENHE